MTYSLYQMCVMLFNTVSIYSFLFTSLPNIFVNKYRTAAIIILTHFSSPKRTVFTEFLLRGKKNLESLHDQ